MKITVIGTGYVGLVSGTCFADMGHIVTCVDTDEQKIAGLKRGIVPIFEPGLDQLVSANHKNGRLKFTSDLTQALKAAEIVIIAVGTPTDISGLKVDLSFVNIVAGQIKSIIDHDAVVIMKSTVPVGTCLQLNTMLNDNSKYRLDVVSNPEFLREGHAIDDFMNPDRIVIGSIDNVQKTIEQLYADHISRKKPLLFTNYETAELIKYAANTALAAKVALINEVASICEKVGGDIKAVAYGVGLDSRIGHKFLSPGPGFGGSCFPKDVKALAQIADEFGCDTPLIKAVMMSNDTHKADIAKNILKLCERPVAATVITIFGLTYKANTDDVRSSPAIDIINLLLAHGAKIKAYDPEGMEGAKRILGSRITFCDDMYSALEDSCLAVILTEWDAFKNIDYQKLERAMRKTVIYDLRGVVAKDRLPAGVMLHRLGGG